ncbi:hypothetical protein D3C87_1370050 [compost metagenome]
MRPLGIFKPDPPVVELPRQNAIAVDDLVQYFQLFSPQPATVRSAFVGAQHDLEKMPAGRKWHAENNIEIVFIFVVACRQSGMGNLRMGQRRNRIERAPFEPHELTHRITDVVGTLVRFSTRLERHVASVKRYQFRKFPMPA